MSFCKKNGCCQKSQGYEQEDYLVCTCMGVMKSEILDAINNGADTFEQLSQDLGVGTGCSSCVEEVQQMLAKGLKKSCCQKNN